MPVAVSTRGCMRALGCLMCIAVFALCCSELQVVEVYRSVLH